MLSRQQGAIAVAAQLRLRNSHLTVLQHGQHLTQLILRQRTEHRVAKLLTDKVAHRLTVVALRQQLGQLLQQLARGVAVLHLRQPAVQEVFRGGKVARL